MPLTLIIAATAALFQSAPGLEAGRCNARLTNSMSGGCFNPRPALRPGDAARLLSTKAANILFQSAPGLEAGRCNC